MGVTRMAFVKVKKVHIDKKGNFKMCYSVSNDDRPYATGTFYADSETVEEKVLRFIEGLNDDIVLTEGCTGNVADALAYMIEFSEIEKPLSLENFNIDEFMRCWASIRLMGNTRYMIQILGEDGVVKSVVNFKYKAYVDVCNDDCLRNYWYAHRIKQRLRLPYKSTARIVHEGYKD